MKGIAILAATFLVSVVVWHLIGRYHIGAPSDPYGPCPSGSHYVSFWQQGIKYAVQAGVVHYHGWTEVATCGASLNLHVG